MLESLRTDPRFPALLRKVGMAPARDRHALVISRMGRSGYDLPTPMEQISFAL